MSLHFIIEDGQDLVEFRRLLDRSMNTWEPKDRPAWLQDMSDRVDRRLGILPEPSRGMRGDDPTMTSQLPAMAEAAASQIDEIRGVMRPLEPHEEAGLRQFLAQRL